MRFGAVGCSHTSLSYGDSWPIHLGKEIKATPSIASSSGAGNSMFIEKVRNLSDQDVQLMVVQVTEPTRITTGLTHFEDQSQTSEFNDEYNDGGKFEDIGYYTWNSFSNDPLFKDLGYDTKIDKFWQREIITSKWCYVNTVHSMLAMQYICESKKIPIIFFSWFLPFDQIIPEQYNWMYTKMKLIPGCAETFMTMNNIRPLPDNHYGSIAHQKFTTEWLSRQIKDFML